MKSTTFLMTACVSALLSGCSPEPTVVYQGPLFCDLYEPRRFSQHVFDWRVENDNANLRRDLTNNEDWKAECRETSV